MGRIAIQQFHCQEDHPHLQTAAVFPWFTNWRGCRFPGVSAETGGQFTVARAPEGVLVLATTLRRSHAGMVRVSWRRWKS